MECCCRCYCYCYCYCEFQFVINNDNKNNYNFNKTVNNIGNGSEIETTRSLSLSSSSLIPYTTPSRVINHNNANLFACIWMLWCVSLSLVRLTNLIQWSTRSSRATITLYLLIFYFVFQFATISASHFIYALSTSTCS